MEAGSETVEQGQPVMSPERQRFNVNLSQRAYADLKSVAEETGRSMTEIIRMGIGLVRIIDGELRDGHKIVVKSKSGETLKELIIPW